MGRFKQVAGTAVAVVLAFLALGDAPEQLANWRKGFDYIISLGGVDWNVFWDGALGRWLLLVGAVCVGLWTWDVPERAYAKFGQRLPTYTSGWWERHFAKKLLREDASKDSGAAVRELRTEVENKNREIERLRGQLGGAEQTLATVKKEFAKARIAWFASRIKANIENGRRQGHKLNDVHVTIRFADYADYALAQQIEKILRDQTGWPVVLDGKNDPLIRPDDEFKIIFESALHGTFSEVASAFSDGHLVSCAVGMRNDLNRADQEHLIVEVLPTVKP